MRCGSGLIERHFITSGQDMSISLCDSTLVFRPRLTFLELGRLPKPAPRLRSDRQGRLSPRTNFTRPKFLLCPNRVWAQEKPSLKWDGTEAVLTLKCKTKFPVQCEYLAMNGMSGWTLNGPFPQPEPPKPTPPSPAPDPMPPHPDPPPPPMPPPIVSRPT
jgi:hypothetical protein